MGATAKRARRWRGGMLSSCQIGPAPWMAALVALTLLTVVTIGLVDGQPGVRSSYDEVRSPGYDALVRSSTMLQKLPEQKWVDKVQATHDSTVLLQSYKKITNDKIVSVPTSDDNGKAPTKIGKAKTATKKANKKMDPFLFQVIVLCPISALLVTVATLSVEKLGGTVGGIVQTIPTITMVASVGEWMQSNGGAGVFVPEMAFLPCAVAGKVMADYLWLRGLTFLIARHPTCSEKWMALPATLLLVLTWFAIGGSMVLLDEHIKHGFGERGSRVLAWICLIAGTLFSGLCAWFDETPEWSQGKSPATIMMYLMRSAIALLVVLLVAILCNIGVPIWASLMSACPMVSVCATFALWHSWGATAAMSPMTSVMLGNASIATFGIVMAYGEFIPIKVSFPVVTLVSWLCGVCFVSLPLVLLFVPALKARKAARAEASQQDTLTVTVK